MADKTHIEWSDATWNPLVGCTKVSPGCDNCYAESVVNRWHAAGKAAFPARFDTVSLRSGQLLHQPLEWKAPRKVFVNSLSDLFHADVPTEFIARVFAVMALAPQHVFQLLTKRHARMHSLLTDPDFEHEVASEIVGLTVADGVPEPDYLSNFEPWWPLPHVWLGVSVENQQWADIRIPALLNTPAAIRWISAEPLLGPLKLGRYLGEPSRLPGDWIRTLDWVVGGGESGPNARPMHPKWARQLRDLCAETHTPYLFKQWGSWQNGSVDGSSPRNHIVFDDGQHLPWSEFNQDSPHELVTACYRGEVRDPVVMARVGKAAAGRTLDGRTHDGYPTALVGAR